MLKRYAGVVEAALFALDLAVTAAAFLGAWGLFRIAPLPEGVGALSSLPDYLWLLLVIVPLWAFLLQTSDLYKSQRTAPLGRELWGIVQAAGFGAVGLLAFMSLLKVENVSRPFLAAFVVLDGLALLGLHLSIRLAARRIRARGRNFRTALIVGSGRHARALAERIAENRHWGLRVIGHLAEDAGAPREGIGSPLLGSARDVSRILCEYVVDEVFVAVEPARIAEMEPVFLHCERMGVTARLALDLFPRRVAKMELDDLDGIPTLAFTTTPRDPWGLTIKRGLDLLGSGLFLALFSWLYLLVALAIKATSRGPVFYRSTRVGMNGRKFTMLKFRSMVADAERELAGLAHLNEMDGPVF